MVDQIFLDELSAKLSALPCPDCGLTHPIVLKLFHAWASDRPVISVGYPSDDTCKGFRQKAAAFASRVINARNVGPYPFDLM